MRVDGKSNFYIFHWMENRTYIHIGKIIKSLNGQMPAPIRHFNLTGSVLLPRWHTIMVVKSEI